jgi:hypothetical protein
MSVVSCPPHSSWLKAPSANSPEGGFLDASWIRPRSALHRRKPILPPSWSHRGWLLGPSSVHLAPFWVHFWLILGQSWMPAGCLLELNACLLPEGNANSAAEKRTSQVEIENPEVVAESDETAIKKKSGASDVPHTVAAN